MRPPRRGFAPSTATKCETARVLPLSDGLRTRRFPIVNVSIIVANFAVWLFYELPHLRHAVFEASFYPCTVNHTCHGPESWGVSWITAMFLHGSWDHILGNMLFLAVFGKNVEDAFGPIRYLIFYFAGGFVAMMTQTLMTLAFGTAAEARVPNLGASGAIAAVLGAYFVLYPNSTVRGLVVIFPVQLSAWFFLGAWFLYQLIEANFGLYGSAANGGGVAFFAHVGGFIFGVVVAVILRNVGRVAPQDRSGALPAPG
jgi:membrane associated rhomboid family serine protease